MASPRPSRRPTSSTASPPLPLPLPLHPPPPYKKEDTHAAAAAAAAAAEDDDAIVNAATATTDMSSSSSAPTRAVHPSFLQPRVATVLGVPRPWLPWLFALRLGCVLPAFWWGYPSAVQLLLHLLLRLAPPPSSSSSSSHALAVPSYAFTEGSLATLWCFACGYLSFFFTDCLMSRWLLNYSLQATVVRLLTINAVNAYVTMTVLSLTGGFRDPRLLLPGWISIATTLTVCYHITHQKINIRKETITSINVFSGVSFISVLVLVAHLYRSTDDYPSMPVISWARLVRARAAAAAVLPTLRPIAAAAATAAAPSSPSLGEQQQQPGGGGGAL